MGVLGRRLASDNVTAENLARDHNNLLTSVLVLFHQCTTLSAHASQRRCRALVGPVSVTEKLELTQSSRVRHPDSRQAIQSKCRRNVRIEARGERLERPQRHGSTDSIG